MLRISNCCQLFKTILWMLGCKLFCTLLQEKSNLLNWNNAQIPLFQVAYSIDKITLTKQQINITFFEEIVLILSRNILTNKKYVGQKYTWCKHHS